MRIDLEKYSEQEKAALVESRWSSSSELWDKVNTITSQNTAIYENRADWLNSIPQRRKNFRVQANRIFPNMESVINSLIANPPGINVLPAKDGETAQEFARKLESYFRKKFVDLNIKETVRMGLRNLYFSRLIVIKAFWNPLLGEGGDFDYRSVDPCNIRVGKYARKEQDSEFCIEEIEDNLCAVVERFPKKREELMRKYGFFGDEGERQMYIKNPDVKYKEAWIQEYVIFKLENIILDTIKNPYWDWEGILISDEEGIQLEELEGQPRRDLLQQIKLQQGQRAVQSPEIAGDPTIEQVPAQYKPYYFNYFGMPRKPYIFATVFNNENSPIGRTDMITLSAELQRNIDKRKMDIDENAELVNGMLKVDSSVMPKSDAQRIRFETKGIIWGKGVAAGVVREMGTPLPAFVKDDMLDSRSEIDNIMAASSAFRGEREGQETKAGRLALIQQSYLRLNELVQVTDFTYHEIFSWAMQLAKTRYTEYHSVKNTTNDGKREVIELIQDDFETGSEVTIIAGKTLPVDDEFKFEQAQNDVKDGFISPADYLQIAQYDNSKELAKNAVKYKINPIVATGITPEEAAVLAPPQQPQENPPSVSIAFKDVQPDGQVQILEKIGVHVDPAITFAEHTAEQQQKTDEMTLKKQAQQHSQKMAEDGNLLKVGDQKIKEKGLVKNPIKVDKK